MAIYLSVYLLLAALALAKSIQDKVRVLAASSILLVFVGTRVNVGCDFKNYSDKYSHSGILLEQTGGLFDAQGNEIGYLWLNHAFSSNNIDFVWFNLFTTAIFLFGFYLFSQKNPRPGILLTLVFPLLFVGLAMSGVRQTLALAFFLAGLALLLKGKWKIYAGLIVAGSLFHASVIFFLPFAIVAVSHKGGLVAASLAVMLAATGFVLVESRIELYTSRYIQGDVEAYGAIIRALLISVPGFFFFLGGKKFRLENSTRDQFLRYGSVLSLMIIPITLFSSVAGERLGLYVAAISGSVAVHILVLINKRARPVAQLGAILLVGGYLTSWFLLSAKASQCYVPYQSALFPQL